MADKIDPNLAKHVVKTQEMLSPFVKKSLLVERHLARPPFRQIHDIIMNINDSTGFFKGLFTAEELDSNNIKTKEAKVAFLQKIIDVLGIATGQTISLKPSKVLSGLEVEKTNEFLQSLGKALKDGVKSNDAVKAVAGKGKTTTDVAKQATKPKSDASKKPSEVKSRSKDPSPAKKPGPVPAVARASEKNTTTTRKDTTKDGASKHIATGSKAPTKPAQGQSQKAKGSTERLNAKPQPQPMKVMPPAPSKAPSKETSSKAGKSQPPPAPTSGPNSRRNSLTNVAQSELKASISRSASFTIQKGEDGGNVKSDSTTLAGGQEFGLADALTENKRRNSEVDADNSDPGGDLDVDAHLSKDSTAVPSNFAHEDGDAANASNLTSGEAFATSLTSANQIENVVDQNAGVRGGTSSRGRQPSSVSREVAVPAMPVERTSAMLRGRNPSGAGARVMNGTAQSKPPDATEESPADGFFARPASARPAAPRPKTASTNYKEDTTAFRPPTSKVSNVLVDTAEENADDDDEADRFVVQEKARDSSATLSYGKTSFGGIAENDGVNIEELAPEQRGFLVNQILETKKEFEDTMLGKLAETELTETERSKLHQNWESEIDKLKGLLQTIARASNPLGKLMDYVQEDIDTMLTELNQYREESRRLDELYEEEQIKMKQELEPIQRQLDEMDDEIKDAEDAVIGTKLEVLRQEEKINKILHGLESVPKGGYGTLDLSKLPKSIKVFGMDVDMNSTGSPFRNDAAPDFSQFMANNSSAQSYLQVPEADLNSLVLEEDYS